MKPIPNCVPEVAGREIEYLTNCVETRWLSPVGPYVDQLEKMFAEYHGVPVAAAVASGTASIHLGLLALGVKPGDAVLCPSLTFIGSVNPILYCGAKPIFLGVDEKTLNIDPAALSEFLETETDRTDKGLVYKRTGLRISALVVVHLYGIPAEMDPIMAVARKFGLAVLEDAAESLGAKYGDRRVGTIGDIGCLSMNGNKVITSGGGGVVISNDPAKVKFCKHLSTQAKADSFEFIHDHAGFNYRLSNLCAAVGVAQMEKLNEFIEKKRRHAEMYGELLEKNGEFTLLDDRENRFNTYWIVVVRRKKGTSPTLIDDLRKLSQSGIGVRPIWYPIHEMSVYARDVIYFGNGREQEIYRTCFCLPSSVGLEEDDIRRVVNAITGG